MHQKPGLVFGEVCVLLERLNQLVLGQEVPGDHREHQTPVVPDVLPLFEAVQKVRHHAAAPQGFDTACRCVSFSAVFAAAILYYLLCDANRCLHRRLPGQGAFDTHW
jgi:hypothetical protein